MPSAEDGGRILLVVHREQRLIHQTHQNTVGIVRTEQRVQGAVRVIGQIQILGFLFHRLDILRILSFQHDGITGGNISGIVDAAAAAGKESGQSALNLYFSIISAAFSGVKNPAGGGFC
jgi:hypothetical protein